MSMITKTTNLDAPVRGTLYIIAAASGTGKTSLTKALVESMPNMKISISHTTRPIRNGEIKNLHYFFTTGQEFIAMVERGEFLEHAKVFDYHYGTSRLFVESELQRGNDIILDIDWQGAALIRQKMPECVTIFLLPPSKAVLRERLEMRKRDDQEIIEQRLALANREISHYGEFDYIVVNDGFMQAVQDLQAIVKARRLRRMEQEIRYRALINELLE